MDGDLYYGVNPRYPFIYAYDFLQDIPSAKVITGSGSDIFDFMICSVIVMFGIIGLAIGFNRLDLVQWCWYTTAVYRKRRLTNAPPLEGGYNKSSSELPLYKVWGESVEKVMSTTKRIESEDTSSINSSPPNDSKNKKVMKRADDSRVRSFYSHLSRGSNDISKGIHVPRLFGRFSVGEGGGIGDMRNKQDDSSLTLRKSRGKGESDENDDEYASVVNCEVE